MDLFYSLLYIYNVCTCILLIYNTYLGSVYNFVFGHLHGIRIRAYFARKELNHWVWLKSCDRTGRSNALKATAIEKYGGRASGP